MHQNIANVLHSMQLDAHFEFFETHFLRVSDWNALAFSPFLANTTAVHSPLESLIDSAYCPWEDRLRISCVVQNIFRVQSSMPERGRVASDSADGHILIGNSVTVLSTLTPDVRPWCYHDKRIQPGHLLQILMCVQKSSSDFSPIWKLSVDYSRLPESVVLWGLWVID